MPAVVAINKFPTDSDAELKLVEDKCKELGVNVALSDVWANGGAGGEELAKEVVRLCDEENSFDQLYPLDMSIKDKLNEIVTKVYGGDGVEYSPKANKEIAKLEKLGFGNVPICMAKTQYSLSDDPSLLGRPEGFKVTIRDIKISAGARFIVALTGEVMTMPGLPKVPSAEKIDLLEDGTITGLF